MYQIEPSFIRSILAAATAPGVLSLAGGLPDKRHFPVDAIMSATENALRRDGTSILQYAGTSGDPALRAWIADRLSRMHGVPTSPEQVLITTGSQQGLDLAAKLFSDSAVAIEEPGYLGARLAFQALRVEMIPIRLVETGADVDALDSAFVAGAQLFYGMSRFQNPSGSSYVEETADRIADLLNGSQRYMVEDDPYGELHYEEASSSLIAARASERVIYLGSFSKSIAPGLRIGYIRAERVILDALEPFKQATDLHSSTFTQVVLRELLTNSAFDFDEHLAKIRTAYRRQLSSLVDRLPQRIAGARIPSVPNGGMFVWAHLPVSSAKLFPLAIKNGVAYVPGEHFFLDAHPETALRINFTNLAPEDIDRAIGRLADSIEEFAG